MMVLLISLVFIVVVGFLHVLAKVSLSGCLRAPILV